MIAYLQDKTKPESRREWLLQLFGHFTAGRKDKQNDQVWQYGGDNHPVELYSEPVVSQKLDYIHLNAVRAIWQWFYE